jgi:hypothetical protein
MIKTQMGPGGGEGGILLGIFVREGGFQRLVFFFFSFINPKVFFIF